MATLQEEAKALGDPTRHRIFRHIADAGRPVDVVELTELTGLHHNAVRQHLSKLVDAGLLVEETAPPKGPGRPRLRYEVRPAAESRWGVTGSYEQLSLLLSEIIRTGDSPEVVGERAGRRLATAPRATAAQAAGADDPVGEMVAEMARAGFEPSVQRHGDAVDVTLQTCAFATTAASDPATVCQLHLGLARGVAESMGVVVDELVVADPGAGVCHLRCHCAPEAAQPGHP